MTIAALLRHHGVNVPRYVTVEGRVVFDGVTTTGPGAHNHATLGTVTPVASHTFHGGDEESDAKGDALTAWWADEEEINRHIEAMKKSFPKFTYVPAGNDLGPCWVGAIDTGRGKFNVAVILRHDKQLPRVAVLGVGRLGVPVGRRWVQSPHLYDNGNLCVADVGDWKPEEHTAATVTAWASHWLAAYTEWRMTRRWPAEGAQSDVA
ncbi:hypothetical protein StoSoilA2_26090 [Arthrobacter sp. StoSoilA2]|uniref:hypothetical protein n=1 Tax=Arthrobacter sp. StoSoilA2 TaxID=2830990 RepID=UPI001CC69E2D|nr:hypothetical protein [Arthrobacter sp. StoSoilA2]BCW36553.1 hypothetical protein StoSoilA2_26090 [Arthrobacter sp. StoSoilA2]